MGMVIIEFLLLSGLIAVVVVAITAGYKIGKGRVKDHDGTSDSTK